MRHLSLMLKPSSGMCNMRCKYCFYADETQKRSVPSYGFMSLETLEQVMKKALEAADGSCTICFQGGRAHSGGAGLLPSRSGAGRALERPRLRRLLCPPDQRPAHRRGMVPLPGPAPLSGGGLPGRHQGPPRCQPGGRPVQGDLYPGLPGHPAPPAARRGHQRPHRPHGEPLPELSEGLPVL